MTAPKEFPYVPPELLARLEEAFPDKALRLSDIDDGDAVEVGMVASALAGIQDVLDLLRHHLTKQQTPDRSR